jgi:hypothetical protein
VPTKLLRENTTASTLIHAIVMACTLRIRRKVSGAPICSTETIWVSIIPQQQFTPRITTLPTRSKDHLSRQRRQLLPRQTVPP